MKILSLNVRGLGGKTKLCSLWSLFRSVAPDMILLQETMCSSYPALLSFSKILPNWEFCAIDALGLLGGLLKAWNPFLVRCHAFETAAGILLKSNFRGMTSPLTILNCYGPYWNREFFWDRLLIGGLLTTPNLILGGYLNLTLNALETWGTKAVLDPLASHFKLMFNSVDLVDVAPLDVGPT